MFFFGGGGPFQFQRHNPRRVWREVKMGRMSVCSACPATVALNNLMHLEELMLDSMTAVVSQGSLSGYLSLPLWCLLKY